jgi:hypothetical protein
MIAVDLVAAAKAGNDAKFEDADARWSANAVKIAGLLSGANPHWPKKDVIELLNVHLSLTKGEAVAGLQKNWGADVQAFDDIFTEINTVADTLSCGIMAQFPDRF